MRTVDHEIAVEASQADMWFLQSTEPVNSAYLDSPLHGEPKTGSVLDATQHSNNVAFVTGYDCATRLKGST